MRFNTLDEWLAWQEALHPKEIDLGLARVKKVFAALALREKPPFTITVGGTNGKGSCIALLDAILRAQGYRVGAYTSPHLLRYNERICIDGVPVEDRFICEAFERVEQARGETSLTYFEFGTLAALDIFARAQLDVQLLEVGLGGRLDAVNILDPKVALIVSIDIDHKGWLGETREAIGLEKAGIFRPDVPAVVADPNPPESLLRYAKENEVPLARLGKDFHYRRDQAGWQWSCADSTLYDLPPPALPGDQQFLNASAALQALHLVAQERPVSQEAIREGLSSVRLAARYQRILGEISVLLDVAHNPQAAGLLANHLHQHYADRCIHAVFAIMKDKDILGVVMNLKHTVDHWYLAPLDNPRAASEPQLLEAFKACSIDSVAHGFKDFSAAFTSAKQNADENALILVFGSFYLVSEYLKLNL